VKLRLVWTAVASAIALTSLGAGPASAVPPTTEVTVVVNAETVDSDICADFGFDVTFIENGTFKTKTYYDAEGNVTKTILTNSNVRFTSTATANGKTLTTNYPLVFITYSDADIRVGLRNAYHVPGAGVVLLDAGRLILDVETGDVLFEAGQHELLNGSVDDFCGYFAP
jgi:YD repeat-containing protein